MLYSLFILNYKTKQGTFHAENLKTAIVTAKKMCRCWGIFDLKTNTLVQDYHQRLSWRLL